MKYTVFIVIFFITFCLFSQSIGIGEDVFTPEPSAGLEIRYSNKGLLIPRVSLTSVNDATTIPNPAPSLLVYNTGNGGLTPAGYYYNRGNSTNPEWVRLAIDVERGWALEGNSILDSGANFLGTTNAYPLIFRTNSQERMRLSTFGLLGLGTSSPSARLHVRNLTPNLSPLRVESAIPTCMTMAGWSYRVPITITNPNNVNLTDFQVLITINTQSLISAGKMHPAGDDIRFTDYDGCTLLPFWVESGLNTTQTFIWVKVPLIPANGNRIIYLYYGNPACFNASDGEATFIFFDDFLTSPLSSTKWTTGGYGVYPGMYTSIAGGILSLWSDGNWRILRMNSTFSPSSQVVIESRFLKTANSPWHTSYFAQNSDVNRNRFGFLDDDNVYPGNNMGIQINCDGAGWELPFNAGAYAPNTWYISRLSKHNSNTFSHDVLTSSRTVIAGSFYSTSRGCWDDETWTWVTWQMGGTVVQFDWIFVRKFAPMMPTISVGVEENYVPTSFTIQDVFYISPSGKVGILTTNPGAFTLYVNGPAYSTGSWFSSDVSFKKSIEPLSYSLQTLLKLRPVSFEWNNSLSSAKHFASGRHFGLIAQEVEQILPQLVATDAEGKKALAYYELIPLMIKSIQELHDELQTLKHENEKLKYELRELSTKKRHKKKPFKE